MAPRPSGPAVGLLTVLAYAAALGAASATPCTGDDAQCGRRSQALSRSEQALTKRGTGWGYTDPAVGADLAVLDVAWWYNWVRQTPRQPRAGARCAFLWFALEACS